jgi:hypothetical protein
MRLVEEEVVVERLERVERLRLGKEKAILTGVRGCGKVVVSCGMVPEENRRFGAYLRFFGVGLYCVAFADVVLLKWELVWLLASWNAEGRKQVTGLRATIRYGGSHDRHVPAYAVGKSVNEPRYSPCLIPFTCLSRTKRDQATTCIIYPPSHPMTLSFSLP